MTKRIRKPKKAISQVVCIIFAIVAPVWFEVRILKGQTMRQTCLALLERFDPHHHQAPQAGDTITKFTVIDKNRAFVPREIYRKNADGTETFAPGWTRAMIEQEMFFQRCALRNWEGCL